MSKNRPKHRPSHNPSTHRRSQDHSKSLLSTLRSKWLWLGLTFGLGAAAIGFRSNLTHLFKGDKPHEPASVSTLTPPPEQALEPPLPQAPMMQKPTEYHEWADNIELPNVEEISKDLTPAEIANLFLPKNIRPSEWTGSYANYDSLKKQLLKELTSTFDPKVREQMILAFFLKTIQGHLKGAGEPKKMDVLLNKNRSKYIENIYWLMHEANKSLIPHGEYIYMGFESQKGLEFALYEIEKIQKLSVHAKGQAIEVPVIFLTHQAPISINQDERILPFTAKYLHFEGRYILVNQKEESQSAQARIEDLREVAENHHLPMKKYSASELVEHNTKQALGHEGMHALLHEKYGLHEMTGQKTFAPKKVKNKGIVRMGDFQLEPADYLSLDNGSLQELGAIGYSLMNSKEQAPLEVVSMVAASQVSSSYSNVFTIMLKAALHSSEINEKVRSDLLRKIQTHQLKGEDMKVLALQIPEEEWHRIGEKMAKLAIYLITE